MMTDKGYGDTRRSSIVGGVILIGLGVLFLIQQYAGVNVWRFYWPFYIIVPGLLLFVGMVLGGRSMAPLAIPASIVTTVGLLLLVQDLTDHYESWAYAWALVAPTAVGVGLMIAGWWSGDQAQVRNGLTMTGVGLALFLIFGAFFELAIFAQVAVWQYLWPLLLIAAGAVLLLRNRMRGATQ